MEVSKASREKIIEGEQISSELSSADSCSPAKCQLVQPIYNKRTKDFVVCHIINILLIEVSHSVWENFDLGRVYRPHCIRSVLTTKYWL